MAAVLVIGVVALCVAAACSLARRRRIRSERWWRQYDRAGIVLGRMPRRGR